MNLSYQALVKKDGLKSLQGRTHKQKFKRALNILQIVSKFNPYAPRSAFADHFGGPHAQLVNNKGEEFPLDCLKDKVVAIYFTAKWLPACNNLTEVLKEQYDELADTPRETPFEVVVVSSDQNEKQWGKHFKTMPWLAIPFQDRKLKEMLTTKFEVVRIPTLVLLNKKGQVITLDGQMSMSLFPYPFTETPEYKLLYSQTMLDEPTGKKRLQRKPKNKLHNTLSPRNTANARTRATRAARAAKLAKMRQPKQPTPKLKLPNLSNGVTEGVAKASRMSKWIKHQDAFLWDTVVGTREYKSLEAATKCCEKIGAGGVTLEDTPEGPVYRVKLSIIPVEKKGSVCWLCPYAPKPIPLHRLNVDWGPGQEHKCLSGGYSSDGPRRGFALLAEAQARCIELQAGGVCYEPYLDRFTVRSGQLLEDSFRREVAWVCPKKAKPQMRLRPPPPISIPSLMKGFQELLDGELLITNQGHQQPLRSVLKGRLVGLYFSGQWCKECQPFTRNVLVPRYKELKSEPNSPFEIIFVSWDRSEAEFQQAFSEMPWLGLPFESKDTRQKLFSMFDVKDVPTLVLLDENARLITLAGREAITQVYPFGGPRPTEPSSKLTIAVHPPNVRTIKPNGPLLPTLVR